MIPKNIYQTQKSQDFINSRYRLKEGQDSWKKHEAKGFNYHFYNDQECDSFIKEHFNDIYDAYQKLPIPVMKADLWRYCVVYHYVITSVRTDELPFKPCLNRHSRT